MRPFKSYFIVPPLGTRDETQINRVRAHLREHYPKLTEAPWPEAAELIVVLGGDGTLLNLIREKRPKQPIIALNQGTTGFLVTDRQPERFLETLDLTLAKERLPFMHLHEFTVPILHMSVGGEISKGAFHAVNDVNIECPMTWLNMEVVVQGGGFGRFIKNVRGSGMTIMTPIGSTTPMAKHFQCPVMDPELRTFYVKGVNDTNTPNSGIVLAGQDKELLIRLDEIETNTGIPEKQRQSPRLFVDGTFATTLDEDDLIIIQYLKTTAKLLRRSDDHHWKRIREG